MKDSSSIFYTAAVKTDIAELQYNLLNAPPLDSIPPHYPLSTVEERITIRQKEVVFTMFEESVVRLEEVKNQNQIFYITDGLEPDFELYDKFIEVLIASLEETEGAKRPKLNLLLMGKSSHYEIEFKRRALPQFMVSSCNIISCNSFYQSLAPLSVGGAGLSSTTDLLFDLKTLLPLNGIAATNHHHSHHHINFKDIISQLPLIFRNSTRSWRRISISFKGIEFIINVEENMYRVSIVKD